MKYVKITNHLQSSVSGLLCGVACFPVCCQRLTYRSNRVFYLVAITNISKSLVVNVSSLENFPSFAPNNSTF